jgi:protein-arginine kinase activator protein McsA
MNIISILYPDENISEVSLETKICTSCHKERLLTEYHNNPGSYKNRRNVCKYCRKKGGLADAGASRDLMKKYKITRPPVGTPCACCGKTNEKLLCDHIHNTEIIRGFICDNCNVGIGRLGDTLDGVMKAVQYLSRNTH